jgi:hypothetical protein
MHAYCGLEKTAYNEQTNALAEAFKTGSDDNYSSALLTYKEAISKIDIKNVIKTTPTTVWDFEEIVKDKKTKMPDGVYKPWLEAFSRNPNSVDTDSLGLVKEPLFIKDNEDQNSYLPSEDYANAVYDALKAGKYLLINYFEDKHTVLGYGYTNNGEILIADSRANTFGEKNEPCLYALPLHKLLQ